MNSPSIKLPDEPIIVYTAPKDLTEEGISLMFSSIADLLDEHGPCYLIANTRQLVTDFSQVLKIMQAQARGGRGTSADTRIIEAVFVATTSFINLLRDLMAKSKATNQRYVPLMNNYEDALIFVRERIKINEEKTAEVPVVKPSTAEAS